jgi:hypothetical protein
LNKLHGENSTKRSISGLGLAEAWQPAKLAPRWAAAGCTVGNGEQTQSIDQLPVAGAEFSATNSEAQPHLTVATPAPFTIALHLVSTPSCARDSPADKATSATGDPSAAASVRPLKAKDC